MSASRGHFAHIDALRAIAALLVVYAHTAEIFADPQGSWAREISYQMDFGRTGVLIFFLISGVLIPSSLRGNIGSGARSFVIRRFFRLFPLYWFSIPLGLISMWWLQGLSLPSWEVALNLTMVQELFGARNVMPPYWTLRVELYFYGLCLLLFLLGKLHQEGVIITMVLGAIGSQVLYQLATSEEIAIGALGSTTLTFLGFMFAGALWRLYLDGSISRFGSLLLKILALSTGVVVPAVAAFIFVSRGHLTIQENQLSFSCALATIVFVGGMTRVRITWRPIAWLGKVSYSIYLLHPVALYLIIWVVSRQPGGSILHGWPVPVYVLAVVSVTLAMSAVTYSFIEAPMIKLGQRLTAKPPATEGEASYIAIRPSTNSAEKAAP